MIKSTLDMPAGLSHGRYSRRLRPATHSVLYASSSPQFVKSSLLSTPAGTRPSPNPRRHAGAEIATRLAPSFRTGRPTFQPPTLKRGCLSAEKRHPPCRASTWRHFVDLLLPATIRHQSASCSGSRARAFWSPGGASCSLNALCHKPSSTDLRSTPSSFTAIPCLDTANHLPKARRSLILTTKVPQERRCARAQRAA